MGSATEQEHRMALREALEKTGLWLFRWRSFLPILIFPLFLTALPNSELLERVAGDLAAELFEGFCLAISFVGLALRCMTVGYASEGTSGRNTKKQKARTLNTTGMYSVVRHPLYFGNFVIFLGLILLVEVWWFILIAISVFVLYYAAIMYAEEKFLREKFGNAYLEWAERTPPFIPRWKGWKPPDLPFAWRSVLRREYSGFFVIIASFSALEIATDLFAKHRLVLDWDAGILFVFGLATYLTLRTLKRRTAVLEVAGR
jgi:protein-S-isoprenylcysteine O-methyltransferase Ste14